MMQKAMRDRIARIDAERCERQRQTFQKRADMVSAVLIRIAEAIKTATSRSQMLAGRQGK
jgi:hypothetical protein